jgi:hypothetical protein
MPHIVPSWNPVQKKRCLEQYKICVSMYELARKTRGQTYELQSVLGSNETERLMLQSCGNCFDLSE